MDQQQSQRSPEPGWTRLRLGDRLWQMPDPEWERWTRLGRIPPDALVLSPHWTRGVWRRADSLEVYHLFRPAAATAGAGGGDGAGDTLPAGDAGGADRWPGAGTPLTGHPASPPAAAHLLGLPRALWGPGVSATQMLVLANLLVSGALVWLWGDSYSDRLWILSGHLRDSLFRGVVPVLLLPLFLHATPSHLLGNMVGLTASGAAVEEFYGTLRTLGLYFFAGLCGAALSLVRGNPVLSVGASGAIMGLYGVILIFLLRYRSRFSPRERTKTSRVYLPLLVLALLPSLGQADFYSHFGGFLGGVFLAAILPPRKDRVAWLQPRPARATATSGLPGAVAADPEGKGRP